MTMWLVLVPLVGALQTLAAAPTIERVSWLQGCWEMENGGRRVEEQWLSPRASSMLGVGRTTRDGALIEYEMVLIRERGTRLAYEAHPSDQEPAVFLSTTVGDRLIVFENLKHDFPQRVGYQRTAPDRLLAWVEGPQDGRTRRIEYPYQRVACAGD